MIKHLLIFFFSVTSIVAQESFSLQEAIDYALEHSSQVELSKMEIENADAQIMQYKSIGMPRVDGSINYQYYFAVPANPVEDFITPTVYSVLEAEEVAGVDPYVGPPEIFRFSFFPKNNLSANIDASMLLFDGSYLKGLQAARLFKDMKTQAVDVTEEQIRIAVTKAYMNILIVEENKNYLENNITTIEKSLWDVNAIYQNGFMEQLDLDRIKLSLANVKTEHQKIEQLIDASYDMLKFQMSYPLEQEIMISEDLEILVDRLSVEDYDLSNDDIDLNKHAQYEQIELGRALNEVNVEQLKKGYLPKVIARANLNESLQRNNLFDKDQSGWIPTASVSLGVNVPIYDGNEKKSKILQAELDLAEIDIQKAEFKRSIEMQVKNAKLQYENAKINLTNRINTLEIVQGIYDKTLIKFKEGVGSSLEVTQAEASLFEMQTNYISALYDLLIAKTDLDIALGNI